MTVAGGAWADLRGGAAPAAGAEGRAKGADATGAVRGVDIKQRERGDCFPCSRFIFVATKPGAPTPGGNFSSEYQLLRFV
jgi:transposase